MNILFIGWQSLKRLKPPLRITLIYVAFGSLWILLSDTLLAVIIPNPATFVTIQIFKGWIYILVTAWLLYQLIQRDVQALEQTQEALRQSEQRFRATFEQAAVGLAHVSLSGEYLQVNQKFCDIVDYTPEELTQQNVQDLIHPDDFDTDRSQAQQLLAGEIPTYSRQVRYLRPDSAEVWVKLTVSLLREASGQPKYFINAIEDITGQRQLEDQLRQAQKMEAVGQLAGGIAHDFNNLLTVITGYSELLLQRHLTDPERLRRDIEQIKRAGDQASMLTRQLLAFSRQQVLQPRVLDLSQVVTETERMLRRLIGEDIELVTMIDEPLGLVKVDPGQIEQIIMNLAVNARDAMPDGGRLTLELTNVKLDGTYAHQNVGIEPGRYVLLAVSDTGHGMDAETQAKIFEPFFTTKSRERGTGLGLATVYGIVKQSGGHIKVYSEPGWGTTFKIYLPQTSKTDEPRLPAPNHAHPLYGTETILLVEDEDGVRELIHTVLAEYGYTVLEASGSTQALSLAEQFTGSIQLLLTDVVLPDMSGLELANRLSAQFPALRVLYMSGYTDKAAVQHGILAADMAFIQKPFTPDALARKMREVLEPGRTQAN